MSISINISGLQIPTPPETRSLAYLDVKYNSNTYSWAIFIPENESVSDFVNQNQERIKAQIDKKEAEWEALTPKTKTITEFDGNTITVNISKDEIVKPEVPDYYLKRKLEYPDIGQQLDSFWKGPSSPEYVAMQQKILEVKNKYPKDLIESDLDELKASKLQYITIMRNSTLNTLSADWNNDTWDADETTSTRIANVLTMIEKAENAGIPAPPVIPWRTYDNQDRYLSVIELVQLGAAIFTAQQAVWQKQAQLKNQISSASSIEEVNSISW